MALNVQYILSQSFANAGITQLPRAPNLLSVNNGQGGTDQFEVGQYDSYSFQVFLTGSGNGMLYQGVSNNCSAFVPYQSASFTGNNQDILFGVPMNFSQYTKLYYSGSSPGQLTASVAFYGRGGRRR